MTIGSEFEKAVAQYQSEQFKEAYSSVRKFLKRQPRNLDALNLASLCSIQIGKFTDTLGLTTKMLSAQPGLATAHYKRGVALYNLTRHKEARQDFERVTEIEPKFADAYLYLGLISKDLETYEESIFHLNKAVELTPENSSAVNNRALVFKIMGRLDEAFDDLSKAIKLEAQNPTYFNNRGTVLAEGCKFKEALTDYDEALRLNPRYAEALFNRGYARKKLGQFDQAVSDFYDHLTLAPNNANAQNELGLSLIDLNRFDEALTIFEKMILLHPDEADLFNNRGLVQAELGNFDDALTDYNKSLSLNPNFPAALSNRGSLMTELHHFDAALSDFEKALSIAPDFTEAKWNKALHLLRFEDFEEGWRLYESRWQREKIKHNTRKFKEPLWLGNENLSGKSILLHAEQGLGDTIQFCRFANKVSDLGANVILDVQPPLFELLSQLKKVKLVNRNSEECSDFDYHCPLMSLPLALNIKPDNIPFRGGYLRCNSDDLKYWSTRLSNIKGPKIGIAWRGNPNNENDGSRSIDLQTFVEGMPQDYALFSLQKDISGEDRDLFEQTPHLQHFGVDLKQTAALCATMDVVVSVDTSIAHLAGALGQKTCLLLANTPDFRWGISRKDSPWYSSIRLYRQKNYKCWNSVFSDVRADIQKNF